MNLVFADEAWGDCHFWQKQDRKMVERISKQIQEGRFQTRSATPAMTFKVSFDTTTDGTASSTTSWEATMALPRWDFNRHQMLAVADGDQLGARDNSHCNGRASQVLLLASPPPICSMAVAADKMSMP